MAFLDLKYNQHLDTTQVNGQRHYMTPSGKVYPSMTTILSAHGKEGLDKWRERVGQKEAAYITKTAADRGTGVHDLAEKHIRGLPLDKSDPIIFNRFKNIQPIIDERISNVYAIETALYSDYLKLAGRTDVIGKFDGINSVIDFKTSRKPKKPEWIESYWMQTSGYAIMWSELVPQIELRPKQLVIIISVEHEPPQVFVQPILPWAKKLQEYLLVHHKDFIK